jgi:hypothetical protein
VELHTSIAGLRDGLRVMTEQSEAEGHRVFGGGYWMFLDYLLEHGQGFTGRPLPRRYVRRQPKACYYNAWKLVRGSKTLRYVEGQCARIDLAIPIDHAWAIDAGGEIVDPTLADPGRCEYYGVIFDTAELPAKYDTRETPLQHRVRIEIEKKHAC